MSIFDADDKEVISPINLIEDGWVYEGITYNPLHPTLMNYDWSKRVRLDLGNGYYCYCAFLFNLKTKRIRSIETYMTSNISNMDAINQFINKQLKLRIEKFRTNHE